MREKTVYGIKRLFSSFFRFVLRLYMRQREEEDVDSKNRARLEWGKNLEVIQFIIISIDLF